MTPWEFIINEKGDLGPFADLLEEYGHPGATVVRELIKGDKFPRQCHFADGTPDHGLVMWWPCLETYTENHFIHPLMLYSTDPKHGGGRYYYCHTEAIWAVINSVIYKDTRKPFSENL